MQARWPNLSYLAKVWDDSRAASEFGRGVLHPTPTNDLYTLPSEILMAHEAKQIVMGDPEQLAVARYQVDELHADNAKLKSELDELTRRLEQADKESNELQEGLAKSQHHIKEQKANRRKADDELLKLMRENETLKAELPSKSITNYK
ncbi:hypothetical protein BHE74_00055797 [Ensete ventricosum]|nr:hypothetical protein BHE74_00055797 [Ensete ventricosum]